MSDFTDDEVTDLATTVRRLRRENRLLVGENAALHRELAAARERLAGLLHPEQVA